MSNKRLTQPSEQEVNALVHHFTQRRFVAAEDAAKLLVKRYPKDAFGYKALGAIYNETKRSKSAIEAMKKAVSLDPNDAELRSNLGNAYKDLRMLDEAERSYKKALALNPAYAEVYSNYGVLLKDRGMYKEAHDCYLTACQIEPENTRTLTRLGHVMTRLNMLDQAELVLRKALQIDPSYTEAIHALALMMSEQQRMDEASALYESALAGAPGNFELHNNQGNLLKTLGKTKLAEQAYLRALAIDSGSATAHNNLGMIQHAQHRALEAEASYRIAIALQPDFPEAISNLGVTLMETGRLEEAEQVYLHALRARPNQVALLTNLGCLYKDQGRIPESLQAFRRALHNDPTFSIAASNLLFTLNHDNIVSAEEMLAEARNFGDACTRKASPYGDWRVAQGRLRIGFVSGDFSAHPVAYWLENVLTELNRDDFDLYAYSTLSKVDEMTLRLKKHFKKWTVIQGISDKTCANNIHEDGIDILIDLSGHTANNRLPVFAYKPAPIQATWLGYFATTGIEQIDYWICDRNVITESDRAHCTETPWPLPDTFCCLTPPDAPEVNDLPALQNGFVTFGCFNNLSKVGGAVIQSWSRILHSTVGAKLFLKTKQLDDEAIRQSITADFATCGIDPGRLILEGASPRHELLASYGRVDIALDPFPYPGGTTSAEAIWMGVPVITKDGDSFLSRVGKTIVTNAGMGDWVGADLADYERKATQFASDISGLAVLRRNLRENALHSPLYDAKLFARNFGDMLKQMNLKSLQGITK
jgi:predicted O-linked N-acetylglucosamine transferase (SPINDLY family)